MIEYYEFQNVAEKIITSPTENPYSKLYLGRTFLIVNRFSKFLQHM